MDALKVLLVDDSESVRRTVADLLAFDDRFEVVGQAANGADGVALAEALRPDVIVMDVQMPVMDGITATRSITRAGLGIAVVVHTSAAGSQIERDARLAGAFRVLKKGRDTGDIPDVLLAAGRR